MRFSVISSFFAVAVLAAIPGVSSANNPIRVEAQNGQIPGNAYPIGFDSDKQTLYSCTAAFAGRPTPGKIANGFEGCHVSFGGGEHLVRSYRVIVDPTGNTPYALISATDGNVPPRAILGGQDIDGSSLFICGALHADGSVQVGKVRPGLGGCNYAYGGREHTAQRYRVLTGEALGTSASNNNSAPAAPPESPRDSRRSVRPSHIPIVESQCPARPLMAIPSKDDWIRVPAGVVPRGTIALGRDSDGKQLFGCIGKVNGTMQPGKYAAGFNGCHIAYGSTEQEAIDFKVLASAYSNPFKQTPASNGCVPDLAVSVGNDSNGSQLYFCVAQHSDGSQQVGKVRPGLNGCHYAWGGQERTAQSYRVLEVNP